MKKTISEVGKDEVWGFSLISAQSDLKFSSVQDYTKDEVMQLRPFCFFGPRLSWTLIDIGNQWKIAGCDSLVGTQLSNGIRQMCISSLMDHMS